MTFLLLSAQILLAIDPPTGQINEYRIYIGTSSNAYFTFHTFPETNRFAISVTNNKVHLACSAVSYEFGESELSNEIVVTIGQVQLSPTIAGPWSNYMSVPIELKEPARFVRVRLEME